VTEPIIEQAVALEELSEPASMQPPVFSRDVQRVGLFVGFLIYGVTWSLLFSVAYQLTRGRFPGAIRQRSYVLAAAALWAVCLLPFLRYPANPPGVGEPESITYRQALYLGMLSLSIAGTLFAALFGRYLATRSKNGVVPWAGALGFLGVFSLVVWAVMPANPDPIHAPLWLVDQFRVRSAAGLALFWLVMGPTFAFFASRAAQPRPVTVPRPT